MKREGRKIVGVVAWDTPMAQLAERAGVDLISVGDSVGKNVWGHATENEVTLNELLVVCKAVRRGAKRALVSCDVPATAHDPLAAAKRLVGEGGAEMVKVLAPPETVRVLARAGIAVFAEFHGGGPAADLVAQAKALEEAGAALLDFRHSGPDAGAAGARAGNIPVIGGLRGGAWAARRHRQGPAPHRYWTPRVYFPGPTHAAPAPHTPRA